MSRTWLFFPKYNGYNVFNLEEGWSRLIFSPHLEGRAVTLLLPLDASRHAGNRTPWGKWPARLQLDLTVCSPPRSRSQYAFGDMAVTLMSFPNGCLTAQEVSKQCTNQWMTSALKRTSCAPFSAVLCTNTADLSRWPWASYAVVRSFRWC